MTTDTARSAHTGRVTNRPLLAATLVLGAVLIAGYATGSDHPVGLLVGAVVVIAVAPTFTTLSLTVGPRDVTVRYGYLGLPRRRYPVARIRSAEAVELSMLGTGGLGWHWSPWRGTRMTVRSGPTLRLMMVGGGAVSISAPDAVAAARVVNAAR